MAIPAARASAPLGAWPTTVMNAIVADSIRQIADELEKSLGSNRAEARIQAAAKSLELVGNASPPAVEAEHSPPAVEAEHSPPAVEAEN